MRTGKRQFVSTLVGVMLLASFVPLAAPAIATATASGIFFSEYVEGSSGNRAVEIYNGTGASVDLEASSYNIQTYFNGSTGSGLGLFLGGTLAAGDVFVVAQSTASPSILAQADQVTTSTWFNGDDTVVLRRGTVVLDAIGQVGFDPGTEWGTGLTSTADNTLRRKASVCAGDATSTDAFDPALEWDGYATDTFGGLGAHVGCLATLATLSVGDVSLAEGDTGTTTFSFTVSLDSPAPAAGVTFDVATADGTATVAGHDYSMRSVTGQSIAAGDSAATFDVAVAGDTAIESDETFFVNVTNVSGAVVSDGSGQGTITNDDVLGPPATVALTAGDGQTTSVGTDFATQLSLVVYDTQLHPVPGTTVTFTPPSTGASASVVEDGPYATDAGGQLAVTLHANTVAGSYQLGVAAGAASVNVNLANSPADPASMTVNAGNNQSTVVGTDFATQLDVTVADAYGNPVPGAVVTFAGPASGASASVVEDGPYTTDTDGNLVVTAHANTVAGAYNLVASAAGASANFNLTNNPGAPASITVNAGDNQSTVVGTDFATQVDLTVVDTYGNSVPAATVTLTPPATGASASVVEDGPYTTDANGHVAVTLHANTVAGSYQLGVAAGTASANVNLTNDAGAPASVAVNAGDNQNTVVDTDFATQLDLTVFDGYGNPVPNATVTFAGPVSGAASSVVETGPYASDASGNIVVTAHANATAGAYDVVASSGQASATFHLTNLWDGTGQLTASGSSCASFAGGTTTPLGDLAYTLNKGKIGKVSEVSVTYWVRVVTPAGANAFTVDQEVTSGNLSTLLSVGGGSNVYRSDCSGGLKATITQGSTNGTAGTISVSFNAPAAGTYFVGLKLSTNSLKGLSEPSPTTVSYEFSTQLVADATRSLNLVKQ